VSVEVHHKSGINNWDVLFEAVYRHLLNKDDMEILCRECHTKAKVEK